MLKNVTEFLAEQKLEELWRGKECCKCDKCKADILARALSKLPPHYVSSDVGELYTRAQMYGKQLDIEITRELAFAMKLVGENPHH